MLFNYDELAISRRNMPDGYQNASNFYNWNRYNILSDNLPVKHAGFAGRATYAYNKKYVAEVSFSYEGSDKFPDMAGLVSFLQPRWVGYCHVRVL